MHGDASAGTGEHTKQTQICHQRKYFEGTYAARVRFTDEPLTGPGGDQLVESFYTISPLKAPMDADYSELDFEYLPNGGWGVAGSTLYETTWETFSPEPNWKKDNIFNMTKGTRAGWHTLVTQVADGKVKYFVDGKQQAEHGERFYPESLMSINFNLWFIKDGAAKAHGARPPSATKRATAHRTITNNVVELLTALIASLLKWNSLPYQVARPVE